MEDIQKEVDKKMNYIRGIAFLIVMMKIIHANS